MAIKINANMVLGSAQYLDARQSVATLDELLSLNTNIIPNGFECYVEALDCKYKYHEDYNETDTGHWKLLNFDILSGKSIVCIGDSLMAGEGWTGGYANCIKEVHPDVNITNIAVSGATLVNINPADNTIYAQIIAYADAGGVAPDLIIFDGGGNDFIYRLPLGTGALDSSFINGVQTTTCDALEYLIYTIKNAWPTTKLLYVTTPPMAQWDDTSVTPSVPEPDIQREYLDAIEKVLNKWGIPIADIYRDGNVASYVAPLINTYYVDGDTVHLKEAGYRAVAPVIEAAINKIYNTNSVYIVNEGGDIAENVKYENESFPDYTNVDLALDALLAKVYYVKPTCSLSADKIGGTFEIGTIITAPITFTWTTNKDIVTQTLTDCILADETVRTATYDTDITSDKTFTLSVSDGENSATSSVSYKFMNNVFWGSAATADTYDSAFVDALSNKKLTNSVKDTYSFNIANGEYGFWAVPSNMTISTVWIGGFEVTVESVGTISYENSQGYTRDYNLYKTGQSGLGSISAEIK